MNSLATDQLKFGEQEVYKEACKGTYEKVHNVDRTNINHTSDMEDMQVDIMTWLVHVIQFLSSVPYVNGIVCY